MLVSVTIEKNFETSTVRPPALAVRLSKHRLLPSSRCDARDTRRRRHILLPSSDSGEEEEEEEEEEERGLISDDTAVIPSSVSGITQDKQLRACIRLDESSLPQPSCEPRQNT
ncbi:hypothetical protein CRUP_022332 [Coryphaenoides rupestris]|nr:hypothetical protein CRUP_022332 [Coryphaenoides rupestris]